MKETGILMTPENYAKCLDGTKTQTRRIVNGDGSAWEASLLGSGRWKEALKCPFGTVGDRLYVKEAYTLKAWKDNECAQAGCPNAPTHPTEQYLDQPLRAIHKLSYNTGIGNPGKWTSPLLMPKWAARLWLELTEVRVERLMAISNDEAEAEGCEGREGFDPYEVYAELWDSIHGEGSWNTDPFVWVLSFRKVQP